MTQICASPSGQSTMNASTAGCSTPSRQIDENAQHHHQIDQQHQQFQHDFGAFQSSNNESDGQNQFQQQEQIGGYHQHHRPMAPPPPICAQCSQPIADKYILRVHPNLEFHQECLKCSDCQKFLDEKVGKAFLRDDKILCREDYFRLYRRCHRCGVEFQPKDFVMRARQLMFHMDCFNCIACNHSLRPGEHFLLQQNELFCRPECFMIFQQIPTHPIPFPPPPQFTTLQPNANVDFQSPKPIGLDAGNGNSIFELAPLRQGTVTGNVGNNNSTNSSSANFARPQPLQLAQQNCPSAVSSSIVSPLSFSNGDDSSLTPSSTNASTPTQNVGGGMAFGNGNQFHGQNSNNFETGMGGNGGQGVMAFSGANSQGTGSNCSSSSGSMGGGSGSTKPHHFGGGKKSKKDKPLKAQRVRTVLNESQLKILKQTYNQNQRPDTVTKEHLVEMTGLNPRVIRVWFQNKRCKDKKRQLEHREKLQNQEKEQALRGVRISGIGPLTVSSPTPLMVEQQNLQQSGQFPPVDIRQIQQNSTGLWGPDGIGGDQIGGMNGCGIGISNQQMDSSAFQHPGALAIQMSNGIPPDLMHPAGQMLPSISMFPQHAMSE